MSSGVVEPLGASEHHEHVVDQVIAERIRAVYDSNALATALYGSYARGTANADSDVDVLQLVTTGAGARAFGKVNITRYTPDSLRQMAVRGSLFILHLRVDSRILDDRSGVFEDALEHYRYPSSYQPLIDEVRYAAIALHLARDSRKYLLKLHRLGIYLLRTVVYVRLAEQRTPTFDVASACALLGDRIVTEALELRREKNPNLNHLNAIKHALVRMLGSVPPNRYGSVEGLAVAVGGADSLHAQLLSNVVSPDSDEIDYANLIPPML